MGETRGAGDGADKAPIGKGYIMSDKGTAPAPMDEVWELADDALAAMGRADRALAALSNLVECEHLHDPETGELDIDAYSVFTDGILALIRHSAEQARKVMGIAHANR